MKKEETGVINNASEMDNTPNNAEVESVNNPSNSEESVDKKAKIIDLVFKILVLVLAVGFLALSIVGTVLFNNGSCYIFDYKLTTDGLKEFTDFIEAISNSSDVPFKDVMKISMVSILLIVFVVYSIIIIVKMIISIVNSIKCILAKGTKKKVVRFKKLSRNVLSIYGLGLVFLLLAKTSSTQTTSTLNVFIALASVLYGLTFATVNVYNAFEKDGKFDWKNLLFIGISRAILITTVIILVKEICAPYFTQIMNHFGTLDSFFNRSSVEDEEIMALISKFVESALGLATMAIALSMLGKTVKISAIEDGKVNVFKKFRGGAITFIVFVLLTLIVPNVIVGFDMSVITKSLTSNLMYISTIILCAALITLSFFNVNEEVED